MDVTREYDEYYFLFSRRNYFTFQGCKAVFVKKLIRNIKNIHHQWRTATGCIWPPAVFFVVTCDIAAVSPNCLSLAGYTPLGTAFPLL